MEANRAPLAALARRDTQGRQTLEIHRLGPHPLIQHFLEQLGVARILDKHIHSTRDSAPSHGTTIAVLVHNVLLCRDPLYRVPEWLEPIDPRALGLTVAEKLAINDDRIGRALEQLAEFGGRGCFFQLALRAIKLYRIETRRIHFDTTTVTFSGEYAGGAARDPKITRGHNKDHRPDLKQLVFGLNVTCDGAVPISQGVWSGNQSDDTLHRGNSDGLRDLLATDDLIYVADCKLASKENLRHIHQFNGRFVTVLPRSRKEDANFRDALRRKAARWKDILRVDNYGAERGPERYWSTMDGPSQSEEGFRILWIRSSAKAEEDERSRLEKLEKAKSALQGLRGNLNRGKLKTTKQIRQAIKKILKEHACEQFLSVKTRSEIRTRTKRLRPGRPAKGDGFQYVSDILYDIEVKEQAVALRKEANTDGVFPLVTNLPQDKYKVLDVLQIYRYQPYLERRFENLKTEYAIAPVYLKKKERVVGLLHVYFIAIMVAALIEREVRRAMAASHVTALPLYPEERRCNAPTSPRIFDRFTGVDWYRQTGANAEVVFPVKLSEVQQQVLTLLGLPKSLYERFSMT
jgi:transposase